MKENEFEWETVENCKRVEKALQDISQFWEEDWRNEWETVENSKRVEMGKLLISPTIYLHPLVVSYTFDVSGRFTTHMAYRTIFDEKTLERFKTNVMEYRKLIDVIAKDHNVSVARFNPLVPKGSANKYHLILSRIENTFLSMELIRQWQIRFSNIRSIVKSCRL